MSDERRERYAAAIQLRATGGIKLNSILPEVYDAADAAMAVADAEQTELRHSLHCAGRAWEDYTRENARLRTELEGLKTAHEIEQRDGWKREAAIQRVRALAADMRTWCSHRGIATVCAQDIDDALDGPEAGQ